MDRNQRGWWDELSHDVIMRALQGDLYVYSIALWLFHSGQRHPSSTPSIEPRKLMFGDSEYPD